MQGPTQGTLDIKCKFFGLTQHVRASLWTERSVNCECLPNLNCFVRGKLQKRRELWEIRLFSFLTWFCSLLLAGAVFLSLLISFFFCRCLCVTCNAFLFFLPPIFFHIILLQKPKTLEGWIHITLIDSRRKTPFIFDAVFLIFDEWIEDKECFQSKFFSCLSSPQSWKAEKKV